MTAFSENFYTTQSLIITPGASVRHNRGPGDLDSSLHIYSLFCLLLHLGRYPEYPQSGGSTVDAASTTALQHYSTTAPQHHSTTAPQHYSTTAPQDHSTTAPQHNSTTARQRGFSQKKQTKNVLRNELMDTTL